MAPGRASRNVGGLEVKLIEIGEGGLIEPPWKRFLPTVGALEPMYRRIAVKPERFGSSILTERASTLTDFRPSRPSALSDPRSADPKLDGSYPPTRPVAPWRRTSCRGRAECEIRAARIGECHGSRPRGRGCGASRGSSCARADAERFPHCGQARWCDPRSADRKVLLHS
jgi:hypothetical protein